MDSAGALELAALGRPFTLGTLYNDYNGIIVTEISPWDQDDLTKHIQIRPHKHTDVELVLSDSLEEKTSALSLNLSIKASILFGLFKYEGAAAYLDDNKTSKSQVRVTINYKATTHIKELSMYHLRKFRYPSVIDKGSATHVVTGILYGAQAFFVFDREVSEDENHQEVYGNMTVVVNKMSQLAEEMKGDAKMDPKVQEVENYKCTFHGDVCPVKKPTNFQEAIYTYKSLPEVLKNGEKAVPIKVFMLPLTSLSTKAYKLVRQISVGFFQEVQRVIEDFIELDVRCNDVLEIKIVKQFPDISKQIQYFKDLCSSLKNELKQDLGKKFSIRAKEAQLADILKKIRSSFSNNSLKWWMDCKERKIYTPKAITEKMKNTNIVSSLNLHHETDEVYCFVFTSLGRDEPFLSALSAYVKGTRTDDQNQGLRDVEKEQWYASKEKLRDVRKKAKAFSDFAEDNKDNQKIKFQVVGITDDKQEGSTIYLYKNGVIVNKNCELPSKPETPKLRLHTSF